MPPIGGQPHILAMPSVDTMLTSATIAMLVVGPILLFLGVRLMRLIWMVLFVGLGAVAGHAAIPLLSGFVNVPGLPWIAPIVGAIVVGFMGLVLFRLWIILTFGCLLSLATAGGYLWWMASDQLANLPAQCQDLPGQFLDTAELSQQLWATIDKLDSADVKPEDRARWEPVKKDLQQSLDKVKNGWIPLSVDEFISKDDLATLDELNKTYGGPGQTDLRPRLERGVEFLKKTMDVTGQAGKVIGQNGLGMSIAAVGGLVIGLLIGGLAWRLAAVLMTSAFGALLIVGGLFGYFHTRNPGLIARVQQMGWMAWLGLAGLWLMGVAVQGWLARRRKQPPAPQPA